MAKTDIYKYVDQDTRNIYNTTSDNISLKKEYGLTRDIID